MKIRPRRPTPKTRGASSCLLYIFSLSHQNLCLPDLPVLKQAFKSPCIQETARVGRLVFSSPSSVSTSCCHRDAAAPSYILLDKTTHLHICRASLSDGSSILPGQMGSLPFVESEEKMSPLPNEHICPLDLLEGIIYLGHSGSLFLFALLEALIWPLSKQLQFGARWRSRFIRRRPKKTWHFFFLPCQQGRSPGRVLT